jgi:chemotaxis protein methyltransferase CheR
MTPETYLFVKRTVRTVLAIDLNAYKDEQMKRRLDAWLTRSGAASWSEYFRRIRVEPSELEKFRNYLTINVSAFFRDKARWDDLSQHILPELLKQRPTGLRIWSAGCSIGLEAYSLAMLLHELNPMKRHYLLASDLDRGALAKAAAHGPYTDSDVENVSAEQKARYFEAKDGQWYVRPELARTVRFKEQNLLADPFEQNFDLIVSRNVVIYFTEPAKVALYQKFHEALRPGGFLLSAARS